jgi:predicted N-acyltransferase
LNVRVVGTPSDIPSAEWNQLAGNDPFLSHAFLDALDSSGCATARTGWSPQYILIEENRRLAAAMPLYLKTHSYGEYVFDWAWADAYERHGLKYYPKLLCAIPFTPVSGQRLLANTPEHRQLLIRTAVQLARDNDLSSFHCLYPTSAESDIATAEGLMIRNGVQFHWTNDTYESFDAFLARMSHDKRKKIRQERRRVREAGITFEWLDGPEITPAIWQFFHHCYCNTYHLHRSTPYLNLEFFERIGATMPQSIVMFVAYRAGKPVAAALNIRSDDRLHGRYWGSVDYVPALHFEACYYQGIDYCIARGLRYFEGGAQGEHKIARGLLPVPTRSVHWLSHDGFSRAVQDFLDRESRGMEQYRNELEDRSPFRSNPQTS